MVNFMKRSAAGAKILDPKRSITKKRCSQVDLLSKCLRICLKIKNCKGKIFARSAFYVLCDRQLPRFAGTVIRWLKSLVFDQYSVA